MLDAITTITKDVFYCRLASKLPSQKKIKKTSLPTIKYLKKDASQLFFSLLGLKANETLSNLIVRYKFICCMED